MAEANAQCNKLITDKSKLVEQLSLFEKDSYEIQARVKQGMESERDVENLQSTVATYRDKERTLSRQLETREQDLKLKQSELDRQTNKIETV